jgi:hypothetical protein
MMWEWGRGRVEASICGTLILFVCYEVIVLNPGGEIFKK